ncbi:flavin-dependent dehydrogenase [Halomonas organivorans]|uniref:Flavin-dependent dehydrogenase n=2 Tax=Halomonas organivorans TaxID=257772 RepID=A0A7W5BW46_9GAMM|nr:flavin-dependent dehydrogenase [Halomonas organivorans]
MLDRPARQAFRVGESAAPDVADKLRRLGLSDDLEAGGHRRYYANLSRWAGRRGYDDFLRHSAGDGWHLDRERFDEALRLACRARGVTLLTPSVLEAVRWSEGEWRLEVAHSARHHALRCRYLVDASGRRAALCRRLGVERRRLDELVAVACQWPSAGRLEGITLVESVAEGWWYAAPLPDGSALLALMSDAGLVRRQGLRHGDTFQALWAQTEELQQWLPAPSRLDVTLHCFPAHSGFVTRAAGPGWLAVGDALSSFDPLTSSGISNALGDGLAAAPVIADWLDGNGREAARQYARRANRGIGRFLQEWQDQYRRERRWSDHPFWSRRQGLMPADEAM